MASHFQTTSLGLLVGVYFNTKKLQSKSKYTGNMRHALLIQKVLRKFGDR
jgi:hypothetical protein